MEIHSNSWPWHNCWLYNPIVHIYTNIYNTIIHLKYLEYYLDLQIIFPYFRGVLLTFPSWKIRLEKNGPGQSLARSPCPAACGEPFVAPAGDPQRSGGSEGSTGKSKENMGESGIELLIELWYGITIWIIDFKGFWVHLKTRYTMLYTTVWECL